MTIKSLNFKKLNFQEFFILVTLFFLPFYFVRFRYPWISFNLIEILIVVLFLFWVLAKEKKFSIFNFQFSIPAGLILLGLGISIVVSKNYYVGLGILKGWFVLPMIFAAILFDNLKKNEKLAGWSMQVLFCSGALLSVEGIYYWLAGILTYDGRLRLFFESPNQLAMTLAPAFLAGIFVMKRETWNMKPKKWRVLLVTVGATAIFFNLYLTKSYGAWIGLAVAIFIALVAVSKRKKIAYISFFLMLIVAIAFYTQRDSIFTARVLGERSSVASRVMIWKSAVLMIKDNPVFGIGPGNFQNRYLEYQKYFPPYLEWAAPQPHNLFLAFWLEAGLLGLVGFLWLLAVFFRDNKRARARNPEAGLLYLAIILYFLIHGLVDTTYWKNDSAIIFWMVVVMNHIYSNAWQH